MSKISNKSIAALIVIECIITLITILRPPAGFHGAIHIVSDS